LLNGGIGLLVGRRVRRAGHENRASYKYLREDLTHRGCQYRINLEGSGTTLQYGLSGSAAGFGGFGVSVLGLLVAVPEVVPVPVPAPVPDVDVDVEVEPVFEPAFVDGVVGAVLGVGVVGSAVASVVGIGAVVVVDGVVVEPPVRSIVGIGAADSVVVVEGAAGAVATPLAVEGTDTITTGSFVTAGFRTRDHVKNAMPPIKTAMTTPIPIAPA
jgi:hypothetical protein